MHFQNITEGKRDVRKKYGCLREKGRHTERMREREKERERERENFIEEKYFFPTFCKGNKYTYLKRYSVLM